MKKFLVLFVAALALAVPSIANADITVVLNSGPVVNGANFNWTYTATLKAGATLNTGDFFTIYDVGGFGPGVPIAGNVILPGSNWSSSIQLTGTNGFGQSPVDSSAVYNITFTFTGGSAVVAAVDTVLGGGAGAFGYTSSNNTSFTGAFSATSHVTAGGATAGNTSTVTVAGAGAIQTFSLTKVASSSLLPTGSALSYTITATNNGPASADNAILTDAAVSGFNALIISCTTVSGGAACPPGASMTIANLQGSGILLTTFPATGVITFTLSGTLTALSGAVVNTATLNTPVGMSPPQTLTAPATVNVQVVVPTMRSWMLLALMLSLGLVGVRYVRRTRRLS